MDDLPLNDPRWLPMKAEIEQQTGDRGLAIRDLERDLEAGKRHSMRRNRITGETERLLASYWKTWCIGFLSPSSVTICRRSDVDRHEIDEYGNLIAECLGDWLHYVWQPESDPPVDHDGDSTRADRDDDDEPPPRIKPGPKPTGEWPTLLAKWLIGVAADDRRRLQNVDALVVEAQNFLDNRIGWTPSNTKRLRAHIVELLELVRR